MNDIIEKIGESIIQHGKHSDRVYLIKLSKNDFPQIIEQIQKLVNKNKYSKIFAKVPSWAKVGFEYNNYKTEAYIPNFYEGKVDVFFMSKFLDCKREINNQKETINKVLDLTKNIKSVQTDLKIETNYSYDILKKENINDMVMVYGKVFETYPFPIHKPEYLAETMEENVIYFGIRDKEKLVAISSCEMDIKSLNVEMTDFATLPEYRSKGLASFLLTKMEEEMRKRGIVTAYTIARAISYGINITFTKHQYIFTGTLINNTNISGGIESMNVWYKKLSD